MNQKCSKTFEKESANVCLNVGVAVPIKISHEMFEHPWRRVVS